MNSQKMRIAAALIIMSFFSGCLTIPGVFSLDPVGDLSRSVENRVEGEVASGLGVTAMLRKTMFQMVYAQVFFVGGFGTLGSDLVDLEETQGAVWRYESRSEGDVSVVEAERALLRSLKDGSQWWLLSWKSQGETWAFEVLIDAKKVARRIRYFNADVGRVEEAVFEDTEAPATMTGTGASDLKEWKKLSKGQEKITVGAGAFSADRLVWSFRDKEEGKNYQYTWWITPRGGVVKFEWTQQPGGDSLKGELVSLKKGYTTRFQSF